MAAEAYLSHLLQVIQSDQSDDRRFARAAAEDMAQWARDYLAKLPEGEALPSAALADPNWLAGIAARLSKEEASATSEAAAAGSEVLKIALYAKKSGLISPQRAAAVQFHAAKMHPHRVKYLKAKEGSAARAASATRKKSAQADEWRQRAKEIDRRLERLRPDVRSKLKRAKLIRGRMLEEGTLDVPSVESIRKVLNARD